MNERKVFASACFSQRVLMLIKRVQSPWVLLSIMPVSEGIFSMDSSKINVGLTIDEREIIENAYRANIIRVIICTSTLSSGVIKSSNRLIFYFHSFRLIFLLD